MSNLIKHQKLPNNWEEREKLRQKGQFWTPSWVAEAMVQYVISDSSLIFDPAAGEGAFCLALKKLLDSKNIDNTTKRKIKFYGIDTDKKIIEKGKSEGIYQDNMCSLEVRDFINNTPKKTFKSIVANPPYIRHHRIPIKTKNKLKKIIKEIMGFTIDGRAGLHVYFLIIALNLLKTKGKLAFIMPADTCEGVFSKKLWEWITNKYKLEYVITFSPEATPFPGVDTNAIVFLIKNEKPSDKILWIKSSLAYSEDLKKLIKNSQPYKNFSSLIIIPRNIKEALKTGLSRFPTSKDIYKYKLSDFAYVMRGIATGDNDFFFLTKEKAKKLNVPKRYFVNAIGRTKDIEPGKETLSIEDLNKLDKRGRPTLLLSLDSKKLESYPKDLQKYIMHGEEMKINQKSLLSTRNPWYKMEKREVPNFLFTYLGRKKLRFIKNNSKVVPLTGFLCIYSKSKDTCFIEKLWDILKDPLVNENVKLVGKSYGSGAIKVEPRALEKLPIPEKLVKIYGLDKLINNIKSINIKNNLFNK